MESGFLDKSAVRLLVWFENDEAALAGPAVDNLKWVVKALYAVANQWEPQDVQSTPPMPRGHGENALDCTQKDLAIVVLNEHTVVVEKGEVFPNSGLTSYRMEVAGRRMHETEWVIQTLIDLAHSIEHREGFDYVL